MNLEQYQRMAEQQRELMDHRADIDYAIAEEKRKAQTPDIRHTLLERGNRYGPFSGHALITQNLKDSMRDSNNWSTLDDSKKEALEMIAHKIGRILNGDPGYDDSWRDIAGYAQLVVDQLNGRNT